MMNIRGILRSSAFVAGVALATPSGAVEVNNDGFGQVVILPVWTTTGGHSTLLNVRGSSAAKLRVLGSDGALLFSGNLYFRGGADSWTGAIGPGPDGGSQLSSNDGTCLLIAGDDGIEVMSGPVSLPADHGSVELIAMGFPAATAEADQLLAFQIQREIMTADCNALAERWNNGNWAETPAQGMVRSSEASTMMFANMSIIQVEQGTLYDVPGVALHRYSDQVQHTRPGDGLPNLASGHDLGTDHGSTFSRVCDHGSCLEDSWPTPLDAMAAVLMAESDRGDYIIDPNLGAATDLVISFPLAPYFAQRSEVDAGLTKAHVRFSTYDREGQARVGVSCPSIQSPGAICDGTYWGAEQAEPFFAISFNPSGEQAPSSSGLLGLPGAYRLEAPAESGQQFDSMAPTGAFYAAYRDDTYPDLVSNNGNRYYGAPAIPVIFQQYVNGTLQGSDGIPQRANYGKAFRSTRNRRVDEEYQ